MMLILMLIMMLKILYKRIKQSDWPRRFWGCRVFHYSRAGLVLSLSVTKWPNLPRPPPSPTLSPPNLNIIITWSWRLKNKNKKHGYKNFQQQNKSIFQGNLCKIFCLWCTFLQQLVIHDHEGLMQSQNFSTPLKFSKSLL